MPTRRLSLQGGPLKTRGNSHGEGAEDISDFHMNYCHSIFPPSFEGANVPLSVSPQHFVITIFKQIMKYFHSEHSYSQHLYSANAILSIAFNPTLSSCNQFLSCEESLSWW